MAADGGVYLRRSAADPHTVTTIFTLPQKPNSKNGLPMTDYYEDSHSSRLYSGNALTGGLAGFSKGSQIINVFGTFSVYSGAIYQVQNYLSTSVNIDVPEHVRYKGQELPKSGSPIPTAAGQWGYDTAAGTLYLWLPDSTNPETAKASYLLSVFGWRPMMEEVDEFLQNTDGTYTWRRLAHTQAQFTGGNGGFGIGEPRASYSPDHALILFKSNWGGANREDAFLVFAH